MRRRTPEEKEDEILETLWVLGERGSRTLPRLLAASNLPDARAVVGRMRKAGRLRVAGSEVRLSREAEEEARLIIRRHRLAERLLVDVLDLGGRDDAVEDHACSFEHILSREVTDRICTLLGHPPACPHGRPIPQGPCCAVSIARMEPLVARLRDMEAGGKGSVHMVISGDRATAARLSAAGVVPGAPLVLVRRSPAWLVRVGETTLALDAEVASTILVKRP